MLACNKPARKPDAGNPPVRFDEGEGSFTGPSLLYCSIECAACLDASVAKAFTALERIQPGKEMLVRIVAMLSKLVERFDPDQYWVREDISGVSHKVEDDDEHE